MNRVLFYDAVQLWIYLLPVALLLTILSGKKYRPKHVYDKAPSRLAALITNVIEWVMAIACGVIIGVFNKDAIGRDEQIQLIRRRNAGFGYPRIYLKKEDH